MAKYWICLFLLALAAVNAQQGDDSYPQEWGDYSELYDYESLPEDKKPNDKLEDTQLSAEDKHLKEEFEQIEDNRSAQNLDDVNNVSVEKSDENKEQIISLEQTADSQEKAEENDDKQQTKSDDEVKNEDDDAKVKSDEKNPSDDDTDNDEVEDKVGDTKNEEIIEETKQILEDTDDAFDENDEANDDGDDETNDKYAEEAVKDIIKSSKGELIEEDTVDKVYQDLNEDLDKLMETWKKLNDENNDYVEPEKNADDAVDPDQIAEYEDKYGVPYGEKYVLSLREQNDDDANNDEKLSDEVDDDDNSAQVEDKENLEIVNTDDKDTDVDDKMNDSEDKNNDEDDLFKDDPNADEAMSDEYDSNDDDDAVETDDENNLQLKVADDDAFIDGNDYDVNADKEIDVEHAIPLNMLRDNSRSTPSAEPVGDDEPNNDEAIPLNLIQENSKYTPSASSVADNEAEIEQSSPLSMIRDNSKSTPTVHLEQRLSSSNDNFVQSTEAPTTIDVTHLNAQQYDQLMAEFVQVHSDEFDLSKSDVGSNVAPIHMTLTQEPLIVTSPNYPSPYPTNNIIDWMFTGEGVGIELIISDFFVNGAIGDYLLVKPGGIDASGQDGLVFSHMLNEPRRYRFLDVDQMFVRFEARPGFAFRRGFSFSVRMVSPLPEDAEPEEALPEPEAIRPVPVETFTVLIGGPTLPQFNESSEQFRLLIADMATMYINSNDINPGLNTTREITQITNIAVCNLNWPNSDRCSEVSFGVPLVYDEDEYDDDEERKPRLSEGELRAMWYLYSTQDPFALRLRNLGMEEFTSPNDSGVLTVWLVIGFGLLISMALLAFALWRFSCFENYARMPTYSDRDSVYSEKQGLDLYPTPHQTLPPLFAENEYKWDDAKFEDSTRVDMGGFTNKSYARDELYDIDSDEDVITPTKRDRGFQPRGFQV